MGRDPQLTYTPSLARDIFPPSHLRRTPSAADAAVPAPQRARCQCPRVDVFELACAVAWHDTSEYKLAAFPPLPAMHRTASDTPCIDIACSCRGRILDRLTKDAPRPAPHARLHPNLWPRGSRIDPGVDHDLVTAEESHKSESLTRSSELYSRI
jgi:hypothetical protein